MVHPLLFLSFFHKLLAPLHITGASADAIAYTWLIIALLLVLSLMATSALKSIPGGLQNFMESVVGGIETMIVDTMGEHGRPFFPLIATLAIFAQIVLTAGLSTRCLQFILHLLHIMKRLDKEAATLNILCYRCL